MRLSKRVSVGVLALAALGAPARSDGGEEKSPAGVRVAGIAADAAGGRAHVLVKNEGAGRATFDLILYDRRGAREVGRVRVDGLAPAESRAIAVSGASPRGIEPHVVIRCRCPCAAERRPNGSASAPVPGPAPAPAPERTAAARAIPFVLEPTSLTGRPAAVPERAWEAARAQVLATPIDAARTRFEIRATGLVPGGVYSVWWVDGTFGPTGGPAAPPPAHEVRPDASGAATVTIESPFGLAAHERLVLVYHASGSSSDIGIDRVGQTLFAHLVGKIPRSPRRWLEAAHAYEARSPGLEEASCRIEPLR